MPQATAEPQVFSILDCELSWLIRSMLLLLFSFVFFFLRSLRQLVLCPVVLVD